MYISTHQHIRTRFHSVRPFVRSSCAMLRTGEGPTSPAEECQKQQAAQVSAEASPPKSVDPSHGRIQEKSGKNVEKPYELLVFTCFYMIWCSTLVGCSCCLVFLLMLNDAEWFRMSSGFSQKCLGFDSFWMYLGPRATDVPPSILATASTAGFAGLISDRSWWNWFEHVRFQWVSSHPVSILKLCAFGASSSCAARTSWWVFLWEIATWWIQWVANVGGTFPGFSNRIYAKPQTYDLQPRRWSVFSRPVVTSPFFRSLQNYNPIVIPISPIVIPFNHH